MYLKLFFLDMTPVPRRVNGQTLHITPCQLSWRISGHKGFKPADSTASYESQPNYSSHLLRPSHISKTERLVDIPKPNQSINQSKKLKKKNTLTLSSRPAPRWGSNLPLWYLHQCKPDKGCSWCRWYLVPRQWPRASMWPGPSAGAAWLCSFRAISYWFGV